MKKGTIILFCLFLCSAFAIAQATFIKTLGGTGDDIANSAIETNDGNYLVVGSTSSFGSGGTDGYVSKVNGSAKEIWDKAIGGSGDDGFQNGIQLSNGDFVLVGWSSSSSNGEEDVLVTRLDNFGNVIWTNTFGGSASDIGHTALETSDGDLIIAGHTLSYGQGALDVLIIKLDSDGSEIWSKSYGTAGNDWFNGFGLIEDTQGSYVLTGSFWGGSAGSTPHDGFLMKLDTQGDILLIKGYGDSNNDGLNGHLRETNTGYQNIGISWSWNGPNHEIWMSDFDQNGDLNWSKTFGLAGENIRIGSTNYTNDGNYIISGYDFTEHTNAKGRALLLKVSAAGDVIWSKSYGDIGIETLDAVFETSNGIIAFGKTTSFGAGGNDVFIVRTDGFGTVSGCTENINLTVNDVIPEAIFPTLITENQSLGDSQFFNVSNIGFEEAIVCDGCDADDLTAGLFCETAPIICAIDCLDGFTGTLPNDLIMPQPEPLCNGGTPNNVSWFAFVAGSNTIDLSIIPSNCTTIFDDDGNAETIGIQAGVYVDCNFETSLICHTSGCGNLDAETINISSNLFVEGQIYYLFVDGCGGSVCDYEVVVNSAKQPFEMDEITTISNDLNLDLNEDSLCLGASITLSLNDFDLDVNFNWSIDPPTAEYPSGVHPATDTSSVTFQFSEEGCYDIHVYAYNECDNSETQTFNICVDALEDEFFSDIYVCQECFPITLVSPESGCIITEGGGAPTVLIEDPNGDGLAGWFGTSTIDGPGLDSNLVTNVLGCSYMQYVNVIEIPLSPREQVDYYYCLNDFPVDINGTTFNNPGETKNVTLDGGAASGCDSLLSITAHVIDFFGSSSIGSCEAGEVELAINVNNISVDNYDAISYIWYDEDGDIITDSDGIDSILIVMGIGSYSVQVSVSVGGISCPQTFGPFMIDVDNLAPDIPTIAYAPIEICESELQAQIYMSNQGLGESYIWTFTPNMPFSFGLTADTVYVDVTNGQSFEFCVHAVNGCGNSNEICEDVVVVESPDSEFLFNSEVCLDSSTTFEYTGAFGTSSSSTFNWNFDGGIIVNSMDLNSGGPFDVEFPSAGQYTISLTLAESGCSSILTEHTINVVEPFIAPMIECESGPGMVTFSWDDTNVTDVIITILSGQSSFELVGNTYIIDQLGSEEEINIQIHFNSGDICGGTIINESCTSLPCPDVVLEITLTDQDVCLQDDSNVMVDIDIIGDDTGIGTWSSIYLNNDNSFDLNEAGEGQHLISYSYQLGDCTFAADTLLILNSTPEADVDVDISYCEEMGSSVINILTEQENIVLLDDIEVSDFTEIEVESGDHILTITNPEGCISYLDFNIESLGVEDLTIIGLASIIKGESENYSAIYNSDLEDLILTWTLDNDTICVNCTEVTINLEIEQELCVGIEYGEGCIVSDCLLIEVGERTEIFAPNIFSPNDDNINDLFTIHSNNSNVFIQELMVFDRWGEMVFNKKGFNLSEESNNWDGKFNGDFCQQGVYVYIISYLDEENQNKQISGDLTLVR